MKLKLKNRAVVANKDVSKPHMFFKKDEVVDTEEQYLIESLLSSGCAVEMGSDKEEINMPNLKESKKKMIKEEIKNKMKKMSLNKKA